MSSLKIIGQSGGAGQLRVRYQLGLPCLFFLVNTQNKNRLINTCGKRFSFVEDVQPLYNLVKIERQHIFKIEQNAISFNLPLPF